ncbi:MAG: SulP family inorganic anion transporter, partial [Acidimicrobiia bacterium]|nr:SulP family inorganic anion transporter [Acidimicrobiia bacterium]
AEPGSREYIELAAILALVVGVVRLGLGLVRLGLVAFLMSEPVLVGFTTAAAIVIVASQLPAAVGVMAEGDGVLERAGWTIVHPGEWEGGAIGFSLLTAACVFGFRRIHPLIPGVLIAVVTALVISVASGYDGAVVGALPDDLPSLDFDHPIGDLGSIVASGVIIALVGFAEPASISRIFAAEDRRPWSPNREFASQGLANLASGAVGAFPVGGSFSRSSLNRLAGARTRWSGAVTGFAVLIFLPFVEVLDDLPRAVLAAVVISAVLKLIDLPALVSFWRLSRAQALVAWLTFAATLVLTPRVDIAVLVGISASIAVHLWRELQLRSDWVVDGDVLTVRPQGVFWFASVPRIGQTLVHQLGEHPDARELRIDLSGVGRIDYTAKTFLLQLVDEVADETGLEVNLINIPEHARRVLGLDP